MPYFRHRSFVFAPASASLSTPMICSSVNRRLFIRLLPDEQTLLHSGTNLGEQTMSTVDPVTGLANRCAIDAYLSDQWARLERERLPVSLMLIDVDCFKSYNDHYGHRAGDRCLERVAGALRATLRQRDDLIARYGGEEFVIVLPATSEETAAEMAEHVRGRSSRPDSRTISRASHASSPSASASPPRHGAGVGVSPSDPLLLL